MDWPLLRLQQAGVFLIDCVHATPSPVVSGYPYIAIPQMTAGRIDFESARQISDADYVRWTKKARPKKFDVVLSRRTNPGVIAPVQERTEFALGQNLVLLRADGSRVAPEFLRWLTTSPQWWSQIEKFMNVGAIFNSLKCADVPNFELPIPPLSAQRPIAALLSALDDKIELNRRMNETLEASARALFRDWFVDFGPTRAKVEGRPAYLAPDLWSLFPDRLGDDGVPLGWTSSPISAFCQAIANGGTPKRDNEAFWQPPQISWLTSGEVRQPFITGTIQKISRLGLESSSAKWVEQHSSVVALYGATAGEVAYVGMRLTTNQAICALRPKPGYEVFNYLVLTQLKASLVGMARGSAQQNLSKGIVERLVFVHPSREVVQAFSSLVHGVFNKILDGERESRTLAETRDALLLKLMSGAIRVRDAERAVAA